MSNEELLAVGKVIGLHGVKGEIKVLPFGDYLEEAWKVISIPAGDEDRQYQVIEARPHKSVVLLRLAGIDTREKASLLVGREVLIRKESLKELPEGEYYWFELIGMKVETDEGKHLGEIKQIFSTGSNDVFEVQGPLGEVLIPAVKDVVIRVDRGRKRVVIRLLEGLLP